MSPQKMEVVDLNNAASPPPADPSALDAAWLESYEKLMDQSQTTAFVLFTSPAWKAVDDDPARTGIQLYEASFGSEHGYYALKVHAQLPVRAERLLHVIRDHDERTRLAWDSEHVSEVRVVQELVLPKRREQIRVVKSRVTTGIPKVLPRSLLGIDWWCYNNTSRVFKYVFRTTQHHKTEMPASGCVAIIGMVAALIRVIEFRLCELVLVIHVNPGDSFPSAIAHVCKTWLRDRVALYRRVVEHWDDYYFRKVAQ